MFCLEGNQEVLTENGWKKIKDLEGNYFRFVSVDDNGNPVLSDEAKVIETKRVTELMEIELENGSIIKCTPEHKFMLKDGTYKEAQYLTEEDDLFNFDEHWKIDKYWKQFGIKSEHNMSRYIEFIKSIQNKGNRNLEHCERHHIIPKSLIENDNIIQLTPREHFIAHHILARALGGKMVFAFHRMCYSEKKEIYKVNSRIYEELRIMNSEETSKTHKGKTVSEFTRELLRNKIVLTNGEKDIRIDKDKLNEFLKENKEFYIGSKSRGKSKNFSDEDRKKLSESMIKVSKLGWSNDRKKKFSLKMKNYPQGFCSKEFWTEEKRNHRSELSREMWKDKEHRKLMSEKLSGENNGMFGRKQEFSPNFNKIQITNKETGKMIYVNNNELNKYLNDGWFVGRSEECCNNISASKIKYKYIYDNKEFYGINSKNGLRWYLQNNGYPKISQGTIERIARGIEMKNNPYPELIGKIREEELQ